MIARKILLIGALLLTTACATTHPGSLAKKIDGNNIGLRMSAREVKTRNKLFALLEVSIENISDEWMRIERIRPDLNDEFTNMSVVLGEDLESWTEAMVVEEAKRSHNKELAQLGILLAGVGIALIGKHNHDEALKSVGQIAVAGSYGWILADAFSHAYKTSVGMISKVPANHLYESFSVPPGMTVRKWILFNKSVDYKNNSLVFNVETTEGWESRYAINDL